MKAKHHTRRPSHPIRWMKKPKPRHKKKRKSPFLPCPTAKSSPGDQAPVRDADGFCILVRKVVTN